MMLSYFCRRNHRVLLVIIAVTIAGLDRDSELPGKMGRADKHARFSRSEKRHPDI